MATKKQKQMSFEQYHLLMKSVRDAAQIRLPEVAVLSDEERARVLRPRASFQHEALRVKDLAQALGIDLPGLALEELEQDITWVNELEPVRDTVADAHAALLRALDDTLLVRKARAWTTFLTYYSLFVKMAETNPLVAQRMKPVIDFMAHAKKAKNDDAEPTPEPAPTPVIVPEDDD